MFLICGTKQHEFCNVDLVDMLMMEALIWKMSFVINVGLHSINALKKSYRTNFKNSKGNA